MTFFFLSFLRLICPLNTKNYSDGDELAQQIEEAEAKAPEDLTEEDKMALLGRPKNGDIIRAQLRIKESKEFKVSAIDEDFISTRCLQENFLLIYF